MTQNGTISLYINISEFTGQMLAKLLILSRNPANVEARNEMVSLFPKAKKVFRNDEISVDIISCMLITNWEGKPKELNTNDMYVVAEYYKHQDKQWDGMLKHLLPAFTTMKVTFRYTCTKVLVAPSEICYFLKDYLEKQPIVIGKEENWDSQYDVIMINGEVQDRTTVITPTSEEKTSPITHENAVLEGLKRMREYDKHGDGLCYEVDGVNYTTDEIIKELENGSDIGRKYSDNVYDMVLTYMGKFSQDAD